VSNRGDTRIDYSIIDRPISDKIIRPRSDWDHGLDSAPGVAWNTSTYRLLAFLLAAALPLVLPAGEAVPEIGGVWPNALGGTPCGGAGDERDGDAESEKELGDSPDIDDNVELGRVGGARGGIGITEAARGGGGVDVLLTKLERPGEAV